MTATNRTRLIRFEHEKIFVTQDYSLLIRQTNLSAEYMRFRSGVFYWKIDLLSFSESTGDLTVEVIDYHPIDTETFYDQKLKFKIDKLLFKPLNWSALEPFLVSYRKEKLGELIRDTVGMWTGQEFTQRISFAVSPHFKDSRFVTGGIEFSYDLVQIDTEVTVRIQNSFLRPEFEFIKNYFIKQFRRKTYDVKGEVIIQGSNIKVVATSSQIDRIDEQMIQLIKYAQVKVLDKKPKIISVDKALFSTEDIFDHYDELPSGNVFDLSTKDVLDMMLEHQVVRNKKQLQYLAGKKQVTSDRLAITLQPLFGFVFFIETPSFIHACWELLNSHATYLWSVNRIQYGMDSARKCIEQIIQSIQQTGRNAYRLAVSEQQVQSDIIFHIITHRKSESGVVDPFPKWRYELEEKLL